MVVLVCGACAHGTATALLVWWSVLAGSQQCGKTPVSQSCHFKKTFECTALL